MTGKTGPLLAVLTVLVAFFSAITPARATSDGLIAHWQFDETSGTTASDSKGGNDGTLVNGPVWQPTGGHIGGALSFDGVDDEVDTGTIPGLAADSGNPFTFSFWYKAAPGANDDLFGWSAYRFCTTGYAGGYMACTINSSSLFVTSTTIINDNNWHHIAYTVTNAVQYLYVDGNVEDSASDTIDTSDPTAGIIIGARNFGGYIQAQFDDVRIYNRALSAAEVLELYNTEYCAAPVRPEGVMFYNACCKTYQFCNGTDWINIGANPPQCTNTSFASDLVGHWKLDESNGTTATDSAGGNDGTLVNGPVWQPTSGKIGGALSFDGVDDSVALSSDPIGTNTVTICFWANPATDDYPYFLGNSKVQFQIWPGSYLKFTSNNSTQLSSTSTLPIGSWSHICVVRMSGTNGPSTIYIDGIEDSSGNSGTPESPIFNLAFGAQYDIAGGNYEGRLDDVRIYNRALSAAEIGQLYNGMDWVTTGPDPCGCNPSPGDVCADGTVYAGLSPDGNTPMFVARCDAGQTWDGSACTGTRSWLSWNDGSVGYTNTSIADCASFAACSPSGQDNTAILVAEDSQTAGGFQDHQAAKYCSDLTLHGHSDWYLPSAPELGILYDNMTVIGNFDTVWYQSSSEYDTNGRWLKNFLSAGETVQAKDVSYNIRCVRK